eukprot:768814-Hanusia_phi.AAC.14
MALRMSHLVMGVSSSVLCIYTPSPTPYPLPRTPYPTHTPSHLQPWCSTLPALPTVYPTYPASNYHLSSTGKNSRNQQHPTSQFNDPYPLRSLDRSSGNRGVVPTVTIEVGYNVISGVWSRVGRRGEEYEGDEDNGIGEGRWTSDSQQSMRAIAIPRGAQEAKDRGMVGREIHLRKAMEAMGGGSEGTKKLHEAKVLVVGAGGIGCELLKVLVLSGFKKIEVVDLDTIDVSNLNRQFLFRKEHVKKSKADVAAEVVKKFNPEVDIVAHHGNIKEKRFGPSYMDRFDVIFNALDNLEARRHVSRICVHQDKILIDGGTQGYDGQVVTIKKGVSACYDCEPKPAPKGFPVCTIRSTPDKPVHCIVWGKHLFNMLYGPKDDTDEVVQGISTELDAHQVLEKVFVEEINKLIGMKELWESRKPPTPLTPLASQDQAKAEPRKDGESAVPSETTVLSVEETILLFKESYEALKGRAKEEGVMEWDKDDDVIMNFVLAASNLRAHVFAIEMQTRFRCKEIAGNIIPAIATTNAIISGAMVLEAVKVLEGRLSDCKAIVKNREPSGRKRYIIIPSTLDEPNPACTVCSGGTVTLKLNVEKTTFNFFLTRILKQELGLNEPLIDTGANFFECFSTFETEEDQAALNKRLKLPLTDPSIGIGDQMILSIEDETQGNTSMKVLIMHSEELDPEGERPYEVSHKVEAAAPNGEEQQAGVGADGNEAVEDDDDDIEIMDVPPSRKRLTEEEGGSGRSKRARTT